MLNNITITTTTDTIIAEDGEFAVALFVAGGYVCGNAADIRNGYHNSLVAASEGVATNRPNPFRIALCDLAFEVRFECKSDVIDGLERVSAQLANYLANNDLSYML